MGELVFVVDVDPEHCCKVKDSLEAVGYKVHTPSMDALVSDIKARRPSAILMSARLSDENGAMCQQLRRDALCAGMQIVLMLEGTAGQDPGLVLKAGADAYIAKPFSGEELVAKIGAVLSRFSSSSVPSGATDMVIDHWGMKVSVRGVDIPVTTLEFRLIDYLARHRHQVFTRHLLLDAVWRQIQFVTPRSVDACIRRIRGKIELNRAKPTLLKTVRGVGYKLDATTSWVSNDNGDCTCIACTARGVQDERYAEPSERWTTASNPKRESGKRRTVAGRLDGGSYGARLA